MVELATRPQFLAGLRAGFVSMAAAALLGVWWRWRAGRPAPVAGVLLAVALLWALLPMRRAVPLTVWAGTVMCGAAGLLGSVAPSNLWRMLVTALASVPGALVLGFLVDHSGAPWGRWLVAAGIVVAGPLVADFDDHHQARAWGPPLLAISVLGLLFTVPDTDEALVLTGVALPLALLGGPVRLGSLGRAGSLMAVGILLWVTVGAGLGRESSMVGAAASLGVLVAEPIARLFRGFTLLDGLHRPWSGVMVVGVFQLAVVLVTSRVAGLQLELVSAVVIAALALMTATVLLARLRAARHP